MDYITERTEVASMPGMFSRGTVLLGKYRIDDQLGVGGYGLVLRAHDLALDQAVAIKILRADIDLDEETLQRFMREAQAIVRLKTPHVVRIHDVGQLEDGAPYMVMELLQGSDLGKLLAHSGKLAAQVAADFLLQACDAIAEAHAQGIVHRDIKPTNLFVTREPDGTQLVKVLDFGIAKSPTAEDGMKLTQTASVLGTPAYMSPEQMRSARRVDARSDIWSLGAVLYELVEGQLPFEAENFAEQIVEASMKPFRPMTSAPQLAGVVGRCLAKEPGDRYANVGEFAAALLPFANEATARPRIQRIQRILALVGAAAGSNPALPKTTAAPKPRRLVLAIAAASIVLVGVVIGIIAMRAGGNDSPPATTPIAAPPPHVTATPLPEPPPPAPAPAPAPAPVPIAAPTPGPPPSPAKPVVIAPHKKPAAPAVAPAAPAQAPPAKPKCNPYTSLRGC